VIHLQVVPPEYYLDNNTKRPRHRHNVPPKTPLARHGAGLPEMYNPPGIRARPITNLHITTSPNYVYAPVHPAQAVINTVRNDLTIHEHQCVHHLLVILTRQYAEMDSALKQVRDILIATTLPTNETLCPKRENCCCCYLIASWYAKMAQSFCKHETNLN